MIRKSHQYLKNQLGNTAATEGAALIGNALARVGHLKALLDLNTPEYPRHISVGGFYDGAYAYNDPSQMGGGVFIWDSARDKAGANGGTIIDPANIGGFDGSSSTRDAFLAAQGGGVGSGCWVRLFDGPVRTRMFGAVGDNIVGDSAAITAADAGAVFHKEPLHFDNGNYRLESTVTRTSQTAWTAAAAMGMQGLYHRVILNGVVADIGDGNPMVRCSADGVQGVSIIFSNLMFKSDKVIDFAALDDATDDGVALVDVSHIKNGLRFIHCGFSDAWHGIIQGNDDPYLGKLSFEGCAWTLVYRCVAANPTAGIGLTDCMMYDCFDFIDTDTDVFAWNLAINNSSFASEETSISAATIVAIGGYAEGGQRVFRPSKYLHLDGVKCWEMQGVSLRYLVEPQNDNVTIKVEGVRIPTNTRLVDLSGVTLNRTWIEVSGCYEGVNFSDVSSLATQLAAGLNYRGFGNQNSDAWNIGPGQIVITRNTDFTFDKTDHLKSIYHTSGSGHTATIPANASVPFPVGTELVLYAASTSGVVTIAITSDSLSWNGSTGSRSLAANGWAKIKKISSTTWLLSGEGIT